jgi:hypothetical protein
VVILSNYIGSYLYPLLLTFFEALRMLGALTCDYVALIDGERLRFSGFKRRGVIWGCIGNLV